MECRAKLNHWCPLRRARWGKLPWTWIYSRYCHRANNYALPGPSPVISSITAPNAIQ